MLQDKQSDELIHNWIEKKQKEIYVHIDENWSGCDFQYPGWIVR